MFFTDLHRVSDGTAQRPSSIQRRKAGDARPWPPWWRRSVLHIIAADAFGMSATHSRAKPRKPIRLQIGPGVGSVIYREAVRRCGVSHRPAQSGYF